MGRMSHADAVRVLANSGNLVELAEAVGVLGDDPATKLEELLPALDKGGYPAEQAAIHLHRMTRLPPPRNGRPLISRKGWESHLADWRESNAPGGRPSAVARSAKDGQ